jgi:hypothetical protein
MKTIRLLALASIAALTACASFQRQDFSIYDTYNCHQLAEELQWATNEHDQLDSDLNQTRLIGTALATMGVTKDVPQEADREHHLTELAEKQSYLRQMLIQRDCRS